MSHAQKPTSPIHIYTEIQTGAPSHSVPWPLTPPDSVSSLPTWAPKEPALWSYLPSFLILKGTGCSLPAEGDEEPAVPWKEAGAQVRAESNSRKPFVQATDVQG